MLRYILAFIIFIHGLIHLMGFAKAFGFGNITQLTKDISRPAGSAWLFAALLFIISAIGFLIKKEWWPLFAVLAVAVSQVLIFTSWKDAKFGTAANIIILLAAIAAWGGRNFESAFIHDVKTNLQRTNIIQTELLTEGDIKPLPLPVQNYLRYSGVINRPKVKNARIVFEGEMRGKGKDWFKFNSVQYNFFDEPARLFFMKGKMFGLTVPGYHKYSNEKAMMDIRLFGLFSIVYKEGDIMNKAETVTLFNDMCLLVPASLIDKRISWELLDSFSAKAVYTNGANKISATLYFNEKGQLVNFISDDRTEINAMKPYRFSTPVKEYMANGDRNVMVYGETIWHYPDGEFVYGKFNLKRIEYNVMDYK